MQIQGPNGQVVEVDSESRLKTFAVSVPEDKDINNRGGTFSAFFTVTPVGANDYFLYFKNTGISDLLITDVRVSSTVATRLTYEIVSGTPSYVAETAITPVNRNLGSSKTITAELNYDTDITGLTSGGTIFFEECAVVGTMYHLRTTSNILIPQGKAIAFKRVAATGAITATVSIVDSAA